MAELYNYNSGTHLTTVREGSSFTQSADHGAVGSGSFTIDDTTGNISIVGQKDFRYTESSCANTVTFDGYVASRIYSRGNDRAPDVSAARAIQVSLEDVNDRLNHRMIQGSGGGKRPAETVQERLEWLLASDYAPFDDNGRVDYPTDQMDKADYKYQYAGDVLADCAVAAGSGWNYFLANYGSGVELVFRNDNTSTDDSSDVRISNVSTDVDSDHTTLGANKTFFPDIDAQLGRDPEAVHSKHAKSYAKGTEVVERTATATAFNGERGGTSSNSNIKRQAQARRAARRELHTHSTEDDLIEVSIIVPASAVNLVYPGYRLQCKFSHLATEGYGSFTWMRILERTVKPLTVDAFAYAIDLKLVPQESADPAEACDDDATPSGTFWPLGPLGDGSSHAAPSDGVVYYLRPGIFFPITPTPGAESLWHFPFYGTGEGSSDYAGDCVANVLQFIVVGNGTMVVQTQMWPGAPRTLKVTVSNGVSDPTFETFINAGDSIEIEIDDTDAGDCVRLVKFQDHTFTCGAKWGWSRMDWTAA